MNFARYRTSICISVARGGHGKAEGMANRRLSMRKLREIIRLRWVSGLSYEKIATSCGISPVSVGNYLARAGAAGLRWPLPEELDDAALEAKLFPVAYRSRASVAIPDWSYVHDELKGKGVTKLLVWQEYKAVNAEGYQYSQFCTLYGEWLGKRRLIFRQNHRAGEKMFVDFAGKTMPITNPQTGDVRHAQIFVAVLGASQYSYAEAVYSQDLPNWIGCHTRAFDFFGGVTDIIVPDNLKSGVNKTCRYDPELNSTYHEMAVHYGTAVIPARVRRPQDKAYAEIGVCLVTRWILAVLRKRKFFSLDELNHAIAELLERLNAKPFQKLDGCRRDKFDQLDRPALKSLPIRAYEYVEIRAAKVNVDYHVIVNHHHYSVPYQLTGEKVFVRISRCTVEIMHKNRRIASHHRCDVKWGFTTDMSHRPRSHQKYLEWDAPRFIRWANTIGPATSEFIEALIAGHQHAEQSYSRCLGVLRFGSQYGNERLEAACRHACSMRAFSYQSLKSILKRGLGKDDSPQAAPLVKPLHHSNIRGGEYYRLTGGIKE